MSLSDGGNNINADAVVPKRLRNAEPTPLTNT